MMAAAHFELGCFCLLLAVTPVDLPAQPKADVAGPPCFTLGQRADSSLPRPVALSQQSCNTKCQEQQTDCALRCDQDAACIRRCRAAAEDCTARCIQGPAAPPADRPAPTAGLLLPTVGAVWAGN